jgi:hypothetical protein
MLVRTSSAARSSERFAARRRLRRRRLFIAFCVLLFITFGGIIWGLWQNTTRISEVDIFGDDPSLASYATEAMQGSYVGIIPRDSIFFFPEDEIRSSILSARGDIAALSIFRSSLTKLSIKTDKRVTIGWWCGTETSSHIVSAVSFDEYDHCYSFDANGFIFMAATTSSEKVNKFVLYAPLLDSPSVPLRATIAQADLLPGVFDFARQLATFGSPASSVSIHDGEVDTRLESGTRISYVLAHEQDAYTALVSAQKGLNLADGSIEYIDLRFDGKVYLKRRE